MAQTYKIITSMGALLLAIGVIGLFLWLINISKPLRRFCLYIFGASTALLFLFGLIMRIHNVLYGHYPIDYLVLSSNWMLASWMCFLVCLIVEILSN